MKSNKKSSQFFICFEVCIDIESDKVYFAYFSYHPALPAKFFSVLLNYNTLVLMSVMSLTIV